MISLNRLVSRCWYYFRIGYGTYVAFPITFVSTVVTLYYLAIKNIPELQVVFSRFLIFAFVTLMVAVPVSVLIGWVHAKRSGMLKAEMEISVEENPYNYRLAPGYWKEVAAPAWYETLMLVKRIAETENLLSPQDRERMGRLEEKFEILLKGGTVGKPRDRKHVSKRKYEQK